MSCSLHTSLPPLPNSNRWTSAVSGQIGFVQTRSKTLERFVPVLFTFAVHPNLLPDAWHTPYLPKWPSECFLPTPTSTPLEIFSVDTDAADRRRDPVRLKTETPTTVGFLLYLVQHTHTTLPRTATHLVSHQDPIILGISRE